MMSYWRSDLFSFSFCWMLLCLNEYYCWAPQFAVPSVLLQSGVYLKKSRHFAAEWRLGRNPDFCCCGSICVQARNPWLFIFLQKCENRRICCFPVSVVRLYTPWLRRLRRLAPQTLSEVGVLLQASVDLLNLPSECCTVLASVLTALR